MNLSTIEKSAAFNLLNVKNCLIIHKALIIRNMFVLFKKLKCSGNVKKSIHNIGLLEMQMFYKIVLNVSKNVAYFMKSDQNCRSSNLA